MSRAAIILLAMIIPASGCRHRALPADQGLPIPDIPRQACHPFATSGQFWNEPRGNFSVHLPAIARVNAVNITQAQSLESAATIELEHVAAFAATRWSKKDLFFEMSDIFHQLEENLAQAKLGTVTLQSSGTAGQGYDGAEEIQEAVWAVESTVSLDPWAVRNIVLASFLSRSPSDLSLFSEPLGLATKQLVVKLSLIRRADRLAVTAAVALRSEYDHPTEATSYIVDDLSNGTSLGPVGAPIKYTCDQGERDRPPMADIIWVIDDSGSMENNRQDIAHHAEAFFNKALAVDLDFRMGITGVKQPGTEIVLGTFCSAGSTALTADGGDDRFLLPAEKDLFSSCIMNPPYLEEEFEYGLSNGYAAIQRHLPRQSNSPTKIRQGAQLTLIFVTDETPMELKVGGSFNEQQGFLTEKDYLGTDCFMDQERQQQLEQFMRPLQRYFSGAVDPEAKATVHLIGGVCKNHCSAQIGFGYQELATALSGQVADVCQKDLGATLQGIVESIAASASPHLLHNIPISSSLQVSVNGQPVPRSRKQGYRYLASVNALIFFNTPIAKGDTVLVSYAQFIESGPM